MRVLTKLEFTLALGAYILAGQIWDGRIATILLVIAVIVYFVANIQNARTADKNRMREMEIREQTIRKIVEKHHRVLLRKQRQGSFIDEYGMMNDKKWQNDLRHFVDNVLSLDVEYHDDDEDIDLKSKVLCILEELEESIEDKEFEEEQLPAPQSKHSLGTQFEKECAKILRKQGWNARVTVASGDQGVDIEAERGDGYRIVVQCKYYSSPVGNAAVQEIAAGVQHYQADRGLVVSQSSFTPAAHRLANTTNVLLVDFDELVRIDALLDGIEEEDLGLELENESIMISDETVSFNTSKLSRLSQINRSQSALNESGIGSRFKRAERKQMKPGSYRK